MKKEELLQILEGWFWGCDESYLESESDKGKRAYKEIVAILKNQPTITKRDIECWASELMNRIGADTGWNARMYIEDVMEEMLTELGVSICPEKSTAVDKEE